MGRICTWLHFSNKYIDFVLRIVFICVLQFNMLSSLFLVCLIGEALDIVCLSWGVDLLVPPGSLFLPE